MENNNTNKKKINGTNFFSILKNIFILLIFLQFAPAIIINVKNQIKDALIPKTNVAYLNIKGLIEDSTFYVKKIHEFLKDPNIKALLIKMESPGGVPGSSQAIFNELKKFKEKKPIVTLIENVGASGGYYIACASNHIIANPSSLVGSVGVLMQLPNVKGLLDNWNIKFSYVQSGKFKTAGSPLKDLTPEELSYLQNLSNENYEQFTKDVAQSRSLDLKQQDVWANGRVFTGTQAIKLKLIDQIGSQQEAIDKIKELANITTEIKFIKPAKPSVFAKMFEQDDTDTNISNFSDVTAGFLNDVYKKLMLKQAAENINQI
ncbi:signal peptide peptidase SppA [Candidatus Babeliales bacterium]|nr:signal peptide peptidase SppA [Candidatus Babeliales bacterium]MCF7899469.1 signal peptide peptidase SppA [Candidatus Babeliales bacterium]